MRSPGHPGSLCPSSHSVQGLCHGVLSGVRAWPFCSWVQTIPPLWGSESPAVSLCQVGSARGSSGPAMSHTASPSPHLGKQAEEERPGDAILTRLSLQELCFHLSNPVPDGILNNGLGRTLLAGDGMWGKHTWGERLQGGLNNPVHYQSGLGNTPYQPINLFLLW